MDQIAGYERYEAASRLWNGRQGQGCGGRWEEWASLQVIYKQTRANH